MSKLQSVFKASLESEDEIKETEVLDAETAATETELLEIEASAEEAEESGEIVDELDEVAEGMESIVEFMEASLENGGLEPAAVAALNLAVEAHTKRLGIAEPLIASVESFGGESDRVQATQISMESIGAKLKQIWQAIKNAITKAIRAVADFFAKIFQGVDKQIDRAEALLAKIKGLGEAPKEKMKVPSADLLHVGGKADLATIKKGIAQLRSATETGIPKMVAASVKYYDAVAAQYASSEFQKAVEEKAIEEAMEKATNDYVAVSGTIVEKSKEMAGGAQLVQTREGTVADGSTGEGGKVNPPRLERVGKAPSGDVEIDVPAAKDLADIVEDVKAVLQSLKDKKKNIKDIENARKDAMKKAESFVAAGTGGKLGKAWTNAKTNMALRAAQRDAARPVTQLTRHAWSVSRAGLAFAASAVAKY